MGVIRGARNCYDPVSEVEAEEECPLSDMIESADDSRIALDLSELEASESRRRLRRQRRAALVAASGSGNLPGGSHGPCGDLEDLSSRRSAHKGQRKQRRIQNEKQLRALCELDDDLQEISIYDFIDDSMSAFALILQEKDNITLWNAMLTAEADNEDAYDDIDFGKKGSIMNLHMKSRNKHPASLTPQDCYRRLDSDMRGTLRRQRCPTDMIRTIEEQLETFFKSSPDAVYRARIDNSFARLMLHAVCEYMDLQSKSMDHNGHRWTLVKNPHFKFIRPPMALSAFLESRRSASTAAAKGGPQRHQVPHHHHHPHRLPGKFRH